MLLIEHANTDAPARHLQQCARPQSPAPWRTVEVGLAGFRPWRKRNRQISMPTQRSGGHGQAGGRFRCRRLQTIWYEREMVMTNSGTRRGFLAWAKNALVAGGVLNA